MFVLLKALALAIALALPQAAAAQQTPTGVGAVMAAVRADEWAIARGLARGQGRGVRDIVEWRYLRAGLGTFDEYTDFLERNPDWPGLARIRAKAELSIGTDVTHNQVRAFFEGRFPGTGAAAYRLARAYEANGQTADAQATAVQAWLTLPMDKGTQSAMLSRFGSVLEGHHIQRLDAMLWDGHVGSAKRMYDLVPRGWRALATARITLRESKSGVDARIREVPADLREHPGLLYERFLWRVRKGRTDGAIELIRAASISAEGLGQPDKWAAQRRVLVRRLMREGKAEDAFFLAANNYMSSGSNYADLEWLAGFIALRQLAEPEVALAHFQRFGEAVKTPISLGRAGYWQGRALEALDRPDEALAAYTEGGQYQTSFYGQLAAARAGLPMQESLTGGDDLPAWQGAPFTRSQVFRVGQKFMQAGERDLAEWFFVHLAQNLDETGQAQLANMALSADEPHIALRIAKAAAGQGHVMAAPYFPVTDLANPDHPVPTELVLAVARRESEFDPSVASGVGAQGLMQLMPRTAREVSRRLELDYSKKRLTTDPNYNALLGAAYLDQLVAEFGNNYVLVSAAYNAGPSRAVRWMSQYGDPRDAAVDAVDWIEFIPFTETRNYVMRVMESLPVYRARLSGSTAPLGLAAELKTR